MNVESLYKLMNAFLGGAATVLLFGVVSAVALKGPQRSLRPAQSQETKIATLQIAAPIPNVVPKRTIAAKAPTANLPSVFRREQAMSYRTLMARWNPFIERAAKRFKVPARWVREVMRIESGGRTMMAENRRIVSSQGAVGLMQIQPGTYAEMRTQYRLGPDPFDPHDNIFAGAAYLRWLRGKYGYPVMFEAYDDGPGHLEQRMTSGQALPAETRNYIAAIGTALGDKTTARLGASLAGPAATLTGTVVNPRPIAFVGAIWSFTRPDGSKVVLDCTQVTAVRAPLLNEYAPGVQSVLTVGSSSQGVTENEEVVRQVVRSHGGRV